MNSTSPAASRFTLTAWVVIVIAVIGFLFDTYELLMFPLIANPAVAELLQLPPNHPEVRNWVGNMLWITALSGGIFGLLGGWLTDRLGRKTVLVGSIALYSLSPVFAALSTSLASFIFFRSTTFIGVCVEFVAAITWLAELFPDAKQKEIVLGVTQAFASLGGILVTQANKLVVASAASFPALAVAEPLNNHASWRYLLMTGLIPAIPIALLLPFAPESKVWQERRRAGNLKRPSLGALFSPALRRTTLVTAGLSACAYAVAFGALQLTPTQIAPGLSDLAETRATLKPLQVEAASLNRELDGATPAFAAATASIPGLKELAGQRAKGRQALNAARKSLEISGTDEESKAAAVKQIAVLTNRLAELDKSLTELTQSNPDAKKAVIGREKILGQLAVNRGKQEAPAKRLTDRGNKVQFFQETGGLLGRIVLAGLVVTALARRTILQMFQIPGLIIAPVTYYYLFRSDPELFPWAVAALGFVTTAQFSYFGEFLPKVFPVHLRGTGSSFATNVGGRMIGTSAALVTTKLVAPNFAGSTYEQVATAAAIVAACAMFIGVSLSFVLPDPQPQTAE